MRHVALTIAALTFAAPGLAQAPPLLLNDVLAQVERLYPKLIGAESERQAAAAKAVAKEGAFDPVLRAEADAQRYNSSSTPGKRAYTSGTDLGVSLTTPEGLKVEAGRTLNHGSVKSPDSSTGAAGTYYVALKVPLLRGAGVNEKSVGLAQARIAEPLARQELQLLRLNVRLDASLAYWDWVGAVRKLRVRENLLRLAEERARFVRREIEEKQRAPIDATEADAEAALRRADRTKALRDVEKAALKLQKFLWDNTVPRPEQAPPDEPDFTPRLPTDAEIADAWKRALESRPELARLALQRHSVGLDARLARNDLKPSVELVYAPGLDNGRNGIDNPLKTGIQFSVPLHRRDARGRLDEARAKDEKLEQEERLVRQIVRLEIDDAVSAIRRSAERWGEASENLALTRRVEEGERIRFREGDTTLFLLNQRERQTADAASRCIDIRVEFEQAWALLGAVSAQP